jgi:hypothetical protein
VNRRDLITYPTAALVAIVKSQNCCERVSNLHFNELLCSPSQTTAKLACSTVRCFPTRSCKDPQLQSMPAVPPMKRRHPSRQMDRLSDLARLVEMLATKTFAEVASTFSVPCSDGCSNTNLGVPRTA